MTKVIPLFLAKSLSTNPYFRVDRLKQITPAAM